MTGKNFSTWFGVQFFSPMRVFATHMRLSSKRRLASSRKAFFCLCSIWQSEKINFCCSLVAANIDDDGTAAFDEWTERLHGGIVKVKELPAFYHTMKSKERMQLSLFYGDIVSIPKDWRAFATVLSGIGEVSAIILMSFSLFADGLKETFRLQANDERWMNGWHGKLMSVGSLGRRRIISTQ